MTLANGPRNVRRLGVDVGVWNSLQTGSVWYKGPSARLHYAENFYSTLSAGLAARTTLEATFTAYTSPNNMFNTIREVSLKASHPDRLRPYALVAFELTDNGQADNGTSKGTYAELGMAPSVQLGSRLRLAVPARLGLSVKDYYELAGKDRQFGFAEVSGVVTMRLSVPARFGSWNVRGRADIYSFGETTKAFNRGDRAKVVGSVGIGFTY